MCKRIVHNPYIPVHQCMPTITVCLHITLKVAVCLLNVCLYKFAIPTYLYTYTYCIHVSMPTCCVYLNPIYMQCIPVFTYAYNAYCIYLCLYAMHIIYLVYTQFTCIYLLEDGAPRKQDSFWCRIFGPPGLTPPPPRSV